MSSYNKLEYNQIINIIQKYCKTYLGKKLSLTVEPAFSYEKVKLMLSETMDAVSLLYKKGPPPFAELAEMETYLKTLESNQILSAKALLDLAHLLKTSRELKKYFKEEFSTTYIKSSADTSDQVANYSAKEINSLENNSESSSLLECYFYELYENPSVEKEILDKILDENTISDNASSKLTSLRRNRKNLEQSVKDKLSSFLHSSTYSKYLMEPVITIRNNRYVIPVKQEYRSMIQGFVHDISASGSTIYVEPTSVFEANNQIASLKIEEEIEIEKILQYLSILLYEVTTELNINLSIIGYLDLLFAKAGYAKDNDCVMPTINTQKRISLIKAKHPLIEHSSVVPIDVSLGNDYSALIITGPNTGGKTVALKTTGLLLLMAYSGIPIPCHEDSSICIFDNIFVDIGDEQNIQESLSTFSSHIINIVHITEQVSSNSLVLLDELGSGTDPIEGANLAIAILEYFANIGALTICTTHYQELKEFALTHSGFENASFEFDVENLKPTYHLLLGIPGKSNAFEISKRLGLSVSIIDRANSFIKQDHASIEELLKSIYEDKLEIERQKEESQKNLHQIELLRKSLEQDQSALWEKQQKLIEDAKLEARDILFSAKEEANDILRELNKEHVDVKHANQLRNRLNDKIKEVGQVSSLAIGNSSRIDGLSNSGFKAVSSEEVCEGLEVWIPSLQNFGVILSKKANKNDDVLVQVGLAKMNLKLSELSIKLAKSSFEKNASSVRDNCNSTTEEVNKSAKVMGHDSINSGNFLVDKTPNFEHGKVTTSQTSKAKFISSEINVIGQTVDDAVYVIDKYLDNCAISGMSPVRIVHGKGTGKLRDGIHAYLKKNSHVKSFRLGTFGEGEMGVTVVELK